MDLLQSTVERMANDVNELKAEQKVHRDKITDLEKNDKVQDQMLAHLSASINKIEDNTNWMRRTMTKSIIGGVIGLVTTIAGGVVIFILTN